MPFPITGIEFGDLSTKTSKRVFFANASELVLETGSKTFLEEVTKSGFIPVYHRGMLVEFDGIFVETLIVLHLKVLETILCLSGGIEDSEIVMEFLDKGLERGYPERRVVGGIDNFGFELLKKQDP